MKNRGLRSLFAIGIGSIVLFGCAGSGSSSSSIAKFTQVNLVSNQSGVAAVTDPNLVNPWGISFSPSGPFWISDNGTGLSTLYDGAGAIQPLVVTIPAANGAANGPVSGQTYNATNSFVIPSSTKATFIFVNEDGVISGWNGGSNAVTLVDRSASGAVYKGVAIATNQATSADYIFATNFNSGMVDMYDTNFTLFKSFTDPAIPSGYGPFGVANIDGQIYVTYAKQDAAKHDDVKGAGNGYVDIFNADGTLSQRFTSRGALNSPWGLAVAPSSFGGVGGDLLVGNFGDGKINAFSRASAHNVGALKNSSGQPLVIDGLWGLIFGNGGTGGSANVLYFTAGPNGESNGLFGSLTPSS